MARRGLAAAVLVTAGLVVSGCGAAEPTADPTPSRVPTAPPVEPTPTSTYDGVAPATGTLLTGSIITVNAPAEWTTPPLLDKSGGDVIGPDARYQVLLDDTETARSDPSTDGLADLALTDPAIKPPLTRQPDVVIAGQPAYHLAGKENAFLRWTEDFGFYVDGHDILIRISTPQDTTQTDRDALSASVLASVKLLG